jgi:hypothetical protein
MGDQINREQTTDSLAASHQQADDPYATAKLNLRCIRCDTPVPGALCGRKSPCPSCGYPYPLGDCSDLAEN